MSEVVIAQRGPISVELEAGKRYVWYACGRSKKQPFCDGSHSQTDLKPVLFTAEHSETAYLCCCKQTGSRPFCDGTHGKL